MTTTINNEPKKLNVPNLRFPEFKGEWENCTINELATVVGGGTPDTTMKSYWGGDIQWFTPSEIGKSKYVDFSLRTITREGLNNSSAKILPLHTILLSSRATVGECSIASNECTTNQGFQSLIAKQCNIDFLYYLIQTKKKELIRRACGSTFLEISANEIRKIKVSVPLLNEQEQIAKLLSLIDKRIATQNKIIEDLKKLKSAIIDYTFNNKNISHRKRFLLCDVSVKITRRNIDNQIINVLSNSANWGIIPQSEVFDREIVNENNTSNYFVISKNDFVYNPRKSVTAPYGPINRYNGETDGVISPLYLCFRCYNIDVEYLGWYFKSDSWHKYVYQNGDTGIRHDRVSIKDEIFFLMPLYLHSAEEQMEITKRLNKIESLLSQEEQYLFLLRSQKSYLLQQMFI